VKRDRNGKQIDFQIFGVENLQSMEAAGVTRRSLLEKNKKKKKKRRRGRKRDIVAWARREKNTECL